MSCYCQYDREEPCFDHLVQSWLTGLHDVEAVLLPEPPPAEPPEASYRAFGLFVYAGPAKPLRWLHARLGLIGMFWFWVVTLSSAFGFSYMLGRAFG